MVMTDQWIKVELHLEDNAKAAYSSYIQFGAHEARDESHTAHFFKDTEAEKYELEENGGIIGSK